ncbi:MAG: copper chaperone PCu(A)C, partial [Bacteroidota bacterium]
VPANDSVMLERGGYHVMFMGLTRSLNQGESVDLILTFENAGDVTLTLPVDNERQADHAAHQHDGHKHGD